MPQESTNERRQNSKSSLWQSFHFSGKVIMCSVLFGLGLVLVGGLVMAIGMDQNNDSKPDNLNEVQSKAPMVVVGPVLMGIGAITVITGIIMCLFEMNICRKREPDSKPLIEEQASEEATKSSGSSQKREKHRNHNHKKSRKHKMASKNSQGKATIESSGSYFPSSKPIDVQISQAFTNSDNFLTSSSSLIPAHLVDVENQTSKSLMNSDKSWNTSTEFQTPSSSLRSSESFEVKVIDIEENFNSENKDNKKFQTLQHEFLTPKNSTMDTGSYEKKDQIQKTQSDEKKDLCLIDKECTSNLKQDFETPNNSYPDDFEMAKNISLENNAESISEQNHFRRHDDDIKNINIANETKDQGKEKDKQCQLNIPEEVVTTKNTNTLVATELSSETIKDNSLTKVLENETDLTTSSSINNQVSQLPES